MTNSNEPVPEAGLLALDFAIRAEAASDVEEALRYKAVSEQWRRIARTATEANTLLIAGALRLVQELLDAE